MSTGSWGQPALCKPRTLHTSAVWPPAQSRGVGGGVAPPLPAGYQFRAFTCDFSLMCLVRGTSVNVRCESMPGKSSSKKWSCDSQSELRGSPALLFPSSWLETHILGSATDSDSECCYISTEVWGQGMVAAWTQMFPGECLQDSVRDEATERPQAPQAAWANTGLCPSCCSEQSLGLKGPRWPLPSHLHSLILECRCHLTSPSLCC